MGPSRTASTTSSCRRRRWRPSRCSRLRAFPPGAPSLSPRAPFPLQVIGLYNTCRAHVVLLTELEAKIKKLEYERSMIEMRKQYPAGAPPPVQHPAAGQKRAGGGGHHAPPGKRRH